MGGLCCGRGPGPDAPERRVRQLDGTTADGKRRFLSSRKTGNGPAVSDLAGSPTLDGAGVYATKLPTVHHI